MQGFGDGGDDGAHGVPHQRRAVHLEAFDQVGQVAGQDLPAQPAPQRVMDAVFAEVRGDHPVAVRGQLPGDGVPEPRLKTGSVEHGHGRAVTRVVQVLDLDAA